MTVILAAFALLFVGFACLEAWPLARALTEWENYPASRFPWRRLAYFLVPTAAALVAAGSAVAAFFGARP